MNEIENLLKAIVLLYRESLTDDGEIESKDLIANTVALLNSGQNKVLYSETAIVKDNLSRFISTMIDSGDDCCDRDMIIDSVAMILKDEESLFKTFKEAMLKEFEPGPLRHNITITRKYLGNIYNTKEIEATMAKAYGKFNAIKNTASPKVINDFIDDVVTKLGNLQVNEKARDDAISVEIDFSNTDEISSVVKLAKEETEDGKGLLKTGWKAVNRMIQGGFKRGEFVGISALSHNYKSGLAMSFFSQLPRMNVPMLDDENKKPLILCVSLEDEATKATEFIYRYLYYNEYGKNPNLKDIDDEDISEYIKTKLGVNGFHTKLIRADPTKWTYKNLINLMLKYMSEGFEIQAVIVDYLLMVPTTGCINTGPGGTDYRDMYRRVRNFTSPRRIAFITPQQLGPKAQELLRNGESPIKFTSEVAEKGYTSNSSQLHQELDLELNAHIVRIDRKPYLSIRRGKHRRNGIIDDEDKHCLLPFGYHSPIKEDLFSDKEITYDPFKKGGGDENDDLFGF